MRSQLHWRKFEGTKGVIRDHKWKLKGQKVKLYKTLHRQLRIEQHEPN